MQEDYKKMTGAYLVKREGREKICQPLLKEQEIELFINGNRERVFSCTPEMIHQLVAGCLYSEGIISSVQDIKSMEQKKGSVYVTCKRSGGSHVGKNLFSGFGEDDVREFIRIFFERSFRHRETHASHKAILFTEDKDCFWEADDVSRRAAVEKVIGQGVLSQTDLKKTCLMFSGRIPRDVVLKTVTSGIPLLIGRSYPTGEAVQEARDHGLVLCGCAREDSFVLYAGKLGNRFVTIHEN